MQVLRYVRKKLKFVSLLRPALQLVWQSSPKWTVVRVALIILQGLLPTATIYLTKLIVDSLTEALVAANATDTLTNVFPQLWPPLLAISLIALITLLCTSFSELIAVAQTQKVSDYMRHILYAKSYEVDLAYYENARYHDTLQRAQQEATYRPNQILTRLAQVGQNLISLAAMLGLLLTLHWGITGILLLAALPSLAVKVIYSRKLYHWQRKWTPVDRQSMYLGWLLTGELFAKEIRLFSLGDLFNQRFRHLRQKIYNAKLKLVTYKAIYSLAAQLITGIFIAAIYGFILYETFNNRLKLGDLVVYHQALQRGHTALAVLVKSVSGLYEDNLFLTNLYEFLDLQPQIQVPAQPKAFPKTLKKGIRFENVSFQYEGTERQALTDISLTINPGETVALVGENGSGKTSLIKLLCRLYDPTSGRITVDDMDLRTFDVTEMRQQISVIFQDYAKYHFSAHDNIWIGNTQLASNAPEVVFAAKKAGAHEVIQRLPSGYDTILGKIFDQGEELSIGQWQKVALARAFLRKSQLIVLDEPTSAMDPKAEYEVFRNFKHLIQDQAAILITHRLSTVKMADRIYVMDKGRIVESGTHQELMRQQRTYAYLFEIQAKNYW